MKPGESYILKSDHAECVVLVLNEPTSFSSDPKLARVKVLILDVVVLTTTRSLVAEAIFKPGGTINPLAYLLVEQIGSLEM